MSTTPSIHAAVYSCSWPKITGENAERMQSARSFDPALNVASLTVRSSNENHAGRPAYMTSDNGVSGLSALGYAGLNPTDYIMLESNLRQVEWREGQPQTGFYDTIAGANRANFPAQFAGSSGTSCTVPMGVNAYTNTPYRGTAQQTKVDRDRYLQALHQVYQARR